MDPILLLVLVLIGAVVAYMLLSGQKTFDAKAIALFVIMLVIIVVAVLLIMRLVA